MVMIIFVMKVYIAVTNLGPKHYMIFKLECFKTQQTNRPKKLKQPNNKQQELQAQIVGNRYMMLMEQRMKKKNLP